jgi:hypothetical protein
MMAGNGHNGTLMMVFVLLGFYCLARCWYVGATCSMILVWLVKFVPFVLVPVIAWDSVGGPCANDSAWPLRT